MLLTLLKAIMLLVFLPVIFVTMVFPDLMLAAFVWHPDIGSFLLVSLAVLIPLGIVLQK